jgi:predicted Ser/Thr protein kinase
MASWDQALIEAMTRVAGGENPIQNIDHEAKVIQIKRDARIEPSVLRRIEQAVEELGISYRVEQLT